MKITEIREEIKHHVHTEKEHYIRYGPNDWMIRMYFDVITDDYDISEELAKELEALYQIEVIQSLKLAVANLRGLIKTEI